MPYGEYYYLKKAVKDSRARVISSLRKLIKAEVIVLENEELYLDKAVEISIDHHVAVHDTLYVAQAFCRGDVLLTSNEKRAEIAEKIGVHTVPII